jgi:hypothetical protein
VEYSSINLSTFVLLVYFKAAHDIVRRNNLYLSCGRRAGRPECWIYEDVETDMTWSALESVSSTSEAVEILGDWLVYRTL